MQTTGWTVKHYHSRHVYVKMNAPETSLIDCPGGTYLSSGKKKCIRRQQIVEKQVVRPGGRA